MNPVTSLAESARPTTRRSYGTNSLPSASGVVDAELTFIESASDHDDRRKGWTALRRVLGGAAILFLFGMGVSMANSKQATGASLLLGESLKETPDTPHLVSGDTPALTVRAYNEYGEFDRKALKMYGFQMVVEPYRETTLKVKEAAAKTQASMYWWRLMEADTNGEVDGGSVPLVDAQGGSTMTVTLTRPGSLYVLEVEERRADGTVAAASTINVTCKYVRRELRDLTQADREEFFDTMQEFYTVSREEGKEKYGESFHNYELTTIYHNAAKDQFCYHAGLQFLSAHTAFGLMMERSLQMINRRVSLASWDFMIDAAIYGPEWHDSPIFGDDMFGRSLGSPANQFQIETGRFANVLSIYDPYDNMTDDRVSPNHNPYGYINSLYNYQDLPKLTRTSSYCGLRSHMSFATSDVFVACFEGNDNLNGWEACMERKVHGDMHGLLGGAFDCSVDFEYFQANNPQFSAGLLTFLLEYITTNFWPDNGMMGEYNECDTGCSKGDEDCGCTCLIDTMTISSDEVYELAVTFLAKAAGRFGGDKYISFDAMARYPWGFQDDGVRFSEEENIFLLRHLLKLACEPRSVGYMSGGASPMDPIFWVLHPMFEKALHILWLAPRYRDSYTFEWVATHTCNGAGIDDRFPFSAKSLGFGSETTFMTNRDIMAIIQPSNPSMPYIYDKFGEWGGDTGWDPCPECSAAVDE